MLTILLPLKGRHLHTLRLLWHANCAQLPYHFLIADGGEPFPQFSALLEEGRAAFPHLDMEYIRYPEDRSYSNFYNKMADVSARVRTPYVMQIDNDDFLVRSGIDNCVAFLETNPDFASCSGAIGGFSISPPARVAFKGIIGKLEYVSIRCQPEYAARQDTADSIAERIRNAFACIHTNYYNVFRGHAHTTIVTEIAELNPTDLLLHEIYFGMRTVTVGKTRLSHQFISCLRQAGTGLFHLSRADWAKHLVHSRFTADLDAVVERISEIVAAADGLQAKDFELELRDLFGLKLGNYLRGHYGGQAASNVSWGEQIRKIAHAALPKKFDQELHYANCQRRVLGALASAGASSATIASFSKELAEIENVLSSHEFIEFVRYRAPFLLNGAAAAVA
jgi:glycosyltransferase domain-containing protein